MAITTSPRLGVRRWSSDADAFERADFDASMAALELNAAMYLQGTLAARPAPGKAGRFYKVTNAAADAATVFYDNGASWDELRADLTGYSKTNHTHALTTGAGLLGGATASSWTLTADFAADRTRSATKVVRSDDSRLVVDVDAASNTNIVTNGAPKTIDGASMPAGSRVLLMKQANAQQGVYTITTTTWTLEGVAPLGTMYFVRTGSTYGKRLIVLETREDSGGGPEGIYSLINRTLI